jgi:hypothetical protein
MERDCCLAEDRRWSAATRSRCVRCPRAALRCAECGVAHRLGGLLPGLALSRSRVRSKTAAAAAIDTATPTETDTLSSWSGGSELVPRRLPPTDGGRKAADLWNYSCGSVQVRNCSGVLMCTLLRLQMRNSVPKFEILQTASSCLRLIRQCPHLIQLHADCIKE